MKGKALMALKTFDITGGFLKRYYEE